MKNEESDTPSLHEEVGRGKRSHERPSLFNVKFRELDGFEFWITPYNRIFIVQADGKLSHPRLSMTNEIKFDPPWEGVPDTVVAALIELLERQHSIRSRMVEQGEYDEEGWNWS